MCSCFKIHSLLSPRPCVQQVATCVTLVLRTSESWGAINKGIFKTVLNRACVCMCVRIPAFLFKCLCVCSFRECIWWAHLIKQCLLSVFLMLKVFWSMSGIWTSHCLSATVTIASTRQSFLIYCIPQMTLCLYRIRLSSPYTVGVKWFHETKHSSQKHVALHAERCSVVLAAFLDFKGLHHSIIALGVRKWLCATVKRLVSYCVRWAGTELSRLLTNTAPQGSCKTLLPWTLCSKE